ncbi:DNRLRE domain-containing protein, partial [Candidatus Paralachnospira sp. LCP21S3_A2]
WNSQPSCSDTVLDFKTAKPIGDQTNLLEFDVTKLVRKWYNTGNNYGIELRSRNETQRAEAYVITSNNNFGEEAHPCAYFYYKNAAGLEGYWSYHEQDAGRAGHGYTNDFNGNLVFVHPDAATSGSRLPVTVSHVYNLCDTGKSSRIGNGWRLNVQERLLPTGISDSLYVYTDGDGTRHFFYRDEKDGNKLKDEDGLGFVITREENQANVHEYRLLTG